MSKNDHLSPMDAFSPAHQPDEGYSEDPLNPSIHNDLASALSSLRSPADLSAWLISNVKLLPVQMKTGRPRRMLLIQWRSANIARRVDHGSLG